jgi:hypothetical protein
MKTTTRCTIDGLFQNLASHICGSLAVAFLLLPGLQFCAKGQSDNFDSYSSATDLTAAGWILSAIDPSLVTTTFPAVGTGKGLRIQANPVPTQAPAVGMWYQTNSYADFFLAVDIASWPGTDKNQAAVMFARMTDANTGTVVNNQNPGTAQGVICNYDTSQYGENPGDRRQGQFQINVITAPFNANTIAAADMTLIPGRSYRLIFKGVAWHYIGQVYDWNDLTTPLVTIEADDTVMANPSGACGLLAYSREGTTGTADMTFDNYYAGTNDPNRAAAPILAHPIAGTPAVDTRVPSARWKNFFSLASPISFTANTYSTNVINASATKFRLNGADVSARLALSANGTNISGSLPASLLSSNTLYNAEIVVTDLAGAKTSTNTFWFDTFSDAFLLTSNVKTIEAEEYNYNGGAFQLDPIPVSGVSTNTIQINGSGIGYYDLAGTAGIDFSNHNTGPDMHYSAFRTTDPVRTLSGGLVGIQDAIYLTGYEPDSDTIRSQHAASSLLEYVVCQTQPGEWLDYTRSFASAFYAIYLRYSSFGSTSNELHLVTSDPTQPAQTTSKLGTFRISNNIRQADYLYTPLVDDTGAPVLVNLSGTNTLQLLMAGTTGEDNLKTMLNYILFVQTPVLVFSSLTVNGSYALESGATANIANRTITVPVTGSAHFYRLSSTVPVSAKSITVSGATVTLRL